MASLEAPPASPLEAAAAACLRVVAPGGKLLSQGAEARVYEGTYLGRAAVAKHRFAKAYRHAVLDARLTRERLLGEARALARARRAGVPVPTLFFVDVPAGVLVLERVPGPTVKAWLRGRHGAVAASAAAEAVAAHMGAAVARLHAAGMAHGDLTTSNMMLRGLPESDGGWGVGAVGDTFDAPASPSAGLKRERSDSDAAAQVEGLEDLLLNPGAGDDAGGEGAGDDDDVALLGGLHAIGGAPPRDSPAAAARLSSRDSARAPPAAPTSQTPPLPPLPPGCTGLVVIDFGLCCAGAASVEDRGVDLYVLERALTSAHAHDAPRLLAAAMRAYSAHYAALAGVAEATAVANKFAAVRMRGRKRLAFG